MTDEQLSVANKYLEEYTRDVLKYSTSNMCFVKVGPTCAQVHGVYNLRKKAGCGSKISTIGQDESMPCEDPQCTKCCL